MRRSIAIGAVMVTAAGGGVAWAAGSSTSDTRSAFLDDVAKRLGVSSEKLGDAVAGAYADQLDRAVKNGRLTQAQADALKQGVKRGDVPLGRGLAPRPVPPLPRGHGPGRHRGLDLGPFGAGLPAAADYQGVEAAELRSRLAAGRSLADVAKAEGKSTDGLVDAIVRAERAQLDKAVTAKRLTDAQRDAIVKALPARVKAMVERPVPHLRAVPGRPSRPRPGAPARPKRGEAPAPAPVPVPDDAA